MDFSQLQAILKKMEADDIAILEAQLVPAIFALANQMLPATYQPLELAIEAAVQPSLQSGLVSLLSKI